MPATLDDLIRMRVSRDVKAFGDAISRYKPEPSRLTLETPTAPPKPEPRPSYADDIDAMVAAMIAAGDIIWNSATEQFEPQRVRRWRFGE